MADEMIIGGSRIIVGFILKIGIIVGVDSLAREGNVVIRNYNKIFEFNHALISAMAGNLTFAEEWLTKTCSEWRKGISWYNHTATVKEIGDFLNHLIKSSEEFELPETAVTFLIAGHDDNKVPILWEANHEFSESRGQKAAIGSGQKIARAVLDDPNGTYDYDMLEDAAADLALKSICHVAIDDEYTGGDSIKVFLVKVDGVVQKLRDEKLEDLKKIYFPEEGMSTDDS